MIGRYSLFPSKTLGHIVLTCDESPTLVNGAIIGTFVDLHRHKREEGVSVAGQGEQNVLVTLEARVAGGRRFYRIEGEVRKRLSRAAKRGMPVLDFLIVTSFQYDFEGKARRLKSDHYLLRFSWTRKELYLKVAHLKGIMRMPVGRLIMLILERINAELKERRGRALKIKDIRVMAWGS